MNYTKIIRESKNICDSMLDEAIRNRKTDQIKAARARRVDAKARSLRKRGGKVAGIDVPKWSAQHISGREVGSTSDNPLGHAIRQLKQSSRKHRSGEREVTSSHGKPIGHELVKRKSEIPKSDITRTSQVSKKERGEDVPVTQVHTNKPKSAYATSKGTSVVVPKDPKFMPSKGKSEKSRAYKKRTSGHSMITQFPGRSAPPASQWDKSGHVAIKPKS